MFTRRALVTRSEDADDIATLSASDGVEAVVARSHVPWAPDERSGTNAHLVSG